MSKPRDALQRLGGLSGGCKATSRNELLDRVGAEAALGEWGRDERSLALNTPQPATCFAPRHEAAHIPLAAAETKGSVRWCLWPPHQIPSEPHRSEASRHYL